MRKGEETVTADDVQTRSAVTAPSTKPAGDLNDRPPFFVPERRARTAAAASVVEAVLQELAAWETGLAARKRARRADDRTRHERMVEAVICDIAHRNIFLPGGSLAVSLGKERKTRYAPPPYAPMKSLLEHLGESGLGLLTIQWGHKPVEGWGRMTTFAASKRLQSMIRGLGLADFGRRPEAEPIFLRNTKKSVNDKGGDDIPDAFETWVETRAEIGKMINYKDSGLALRLRREMCSINAWLDGAEITCTLTRDRKGHLIDVGDRWLRRIFNNGYRDFRHGGRLVGGFWMGLSKEERLSSIRIDGEAVGEVDFKAMMPRLLYAQTRNGYPADRDPYEVRGIPSEHRPGIKKVFASLMYGRTAFERYPKGCRKLFPRHLKSAEVVRLLQQQHSAVAYRLGSRVGFQLLRTESDIMVDVLLSSRSLGVVALPIHDAVICPLSRMDDMASLMLKSFTKLTGGGVAAVDKTYPT